MSASTTVPTQTFNEDWLKDNNLTFVKRVSMKDQEGNDKKKLKRIDEFKKI